MYGEIHLNHTFILGPTPIPICLKSIFLVVFSRDLLSLTPLVMTESPPTVTRCQSLSPQYCDQFCFCPAPEPC